MEEHPVVLIVLDDLRRSRLTVFFRLLLAIPHFVWFVLWSILTFFAAIVGWIAMLVTGRLPESLHRFFCAYIRYTAHLTAYLALVANPYPLFTGAADDYPVEVRLPDREAQSRWRTLLRLVLALPALLLAGALGGTTGGSFATTKGGRSANTSANASGLLVGVALLGWFASVFTSRMPRGLRDAGAYGVGYRAQALAYLLFVTGRYPNADPTTMLAAFERPAQHPVRAVFEADDLRRSRVTVLFRLPLAIPLIVWLVLWSILALLAVIVQWFVTLLAGRPASGLHAFLTRYVRYAFHVGAFVFLAANPFPGFAGEPGRYPLDLELPGPTRQNRWKTSFRILLAIPAFIFSSALSTALGVTAVLMWFVALATGSAPLGLRNLATYAVRYGGQANAYVFLLTDAYPNASPLQGEPPVSPPLAEAV